MPFYVTFEDSKMNKPWEGRKKTAALKFEDAYFNLLRKTKKSHDRVTL